MNSEGDRFIRPIPCGFFWEALNQGNPLWPFVLSDSDGEDGVVDYFAVHPGLGGSAK